MPTPNLAIPYVAANGYRERYAAGRDSLIADELERRRAANRRWRSRHPQQVLNATRVWRSEHREQWRKLNREWRRGRYAVDHEFRLKCLLRQRIWHALRGLAKSACTMELIGCTVDYLVIHLETQFLSGMSWENYGVWHVDHRMACANFDLSDPAQQRECFNWRNLQPLWGLDNIRKGDR